MKSLSDIAKSSTDPVDPDLFLWCQGIYHAAADLTMPVENPAARPLFMDGDNAFSFSDIPNNRGMLAVMKELKERGLSQDQKIAMSWRLMHFCEVLKHKKKLHGFIKNGDSPGEISVSEALIKACASARIITSKKKAHFDIEDVARIAKTLTLEEERES